MDHESSSRRNFLKGLGAAGAVTAAGMPNLYGQAATTPAPLQTQVPDKTPKESPEVQADRARRMQWWHQAKFGMFIHWGVYSVLGEGEWVMNKKEIPVSEYEKIPPQFNPTEFNPAEWVALAKAMDFYVFASSAWNAKVSSSGYEAVGASPLIDECAALTAHARAADARFPGRNLSDRATTRGISIGIAGIPVIWTCASDQLAAAEKLLAEKK
jgi:hypothetical protein